MLVIRWQHFQATCRMKHRRLHLTVLLKIFGIFWRWFRRCTIYGGHAASGCHRPGASSRDSRLPLRHAQCSMFQFCVSTVRQLLRFSRFSNWTPWIHIMIWVTKRWFVHCDAVFDVSLICSKNASGAAVSLERPQTAGYSWTPQSSRSKHGPMLNSLGCWSILKRFPLEFLRWFSSRSNQNQYSI